MDDCQNCNRGALFSASPSKSHTHCFGFFLLFFFTFMHTHSHWRSAALFHFAETEVKWCALCMAHCQPLSALPVCDPYPQKKRKHLTSWPVPLMLPHAFSFHFEYGLQDSVCVVNGERTGAACHWKEITRFQTFFFLPYMHRLHLFFSPHVAFWELQWDSFLLWCWIRENINLQAWHLIRSLWRKRDGHKWTWFENTPPPPSITSTATLEIHIPKNISTFCHSHKPQRLFLYRLTQSCRIGLLRTKMWKVGYAFVYSLHYSFTPT